MGGDQLVPRLLDHDCPAADKARTGRYQELIGEARAAGLDAGQVLAVGDSVWDVEAARAVGIGCIGVETGGFTRHELAEAGAVHVYRDVEELGRQMMTGPIRHLIG